MQGVFCLINIIRIIEKNLEVNLKYNTCIEKYTENIDKYTENI